MKKYILGIVIGLFIAIAVFGIVNFLYLSNKEKIYSISIIYDRSGPGKSGSTYNFKYYLENKEFRGRNDGLNKFTINKNGYIFIELLKNDYQHYHVLEFNKVPECLALKDAPEKGWDKLPSDTICK